MSTQNNTDKDKNRISRVLWVFYCVLLAASLVAIGRIIYLQYIWEPDEQTIRHFTPQSKRAVVKPERGEILDCNGKILASSTPLYTIRLDCQIQKKELAKGTIYFGKDSLTEGIWRQKAWETCKKLPAITGEGKTAEEYYNTIVINRDPMTSRAEGM